MKEPGELELVIIQGSQDMEDAPLTAQVVMAPVREDEDESANSHSRNLSQASSYVIVNDDAQVQTPLLEPDETNESVNERDDYAHVSLRTVDISDVRDNDQLSSSQDNSEPADPRGQAPPYFEVVGDLAEVHASSGGLVRVETTDTLPIAPDTYTYPISPERSAAPATNVESTNPPETRRRSVFRGLIDAASRALSSPHPLPQSSRVSRNVAVPPSPRTSNLSSRPAGIRPSPAGHRTTPSNSGSVLSVASSAFGRVASRTRTRSPSNVAAGLTSPSTISISSISSPLTHTAVRTDFVYPRSGPTPEQLKLISSIESVSKFGVPYGRDAVAYASASRVNLNGPPPEFEERPSIDGLPGPSDGTTRARSRSALSRRSQDGNTPEPRPSLSSPLSPPRESTAASATASTPASEPEAAASYPPPETHNPAQDLFDAVSTPKKMDTDDDTKKQEMESAAETVPPRAPSPSPTVGTVSTAATVTKATASTLDTVTESSNDIATSSSHRPALPSFSTATATTTTHKPAAPSAFRMPSTPLSGVRLGSRTSSIETFRTAASRPEQGRESERGLSDTEVETDAFTDAETDVETPHAIPTGSTALSPEPSPLSV
ncbi:hypothetical protein B0F90DRAFT_620561 [Multifurca ochricompacta]|uniref:Uncharacterized protein n=1 Tax=Multifurca ochricompacta TaxID=376703 RepID=A0AAD4M4M3_9AGAM|nr:hypothetical protein B0F90DRAFT_620561 [Multifurca ochricompacta]